MTAAKQKNSHVPHYIILYVPTPTPYRRTYTTRYTILIYEINSLPATCSDDSIIILRSISNRGGYRNLQHLRDF